MGLFDGIFGIDITGDELLDDLIVLDALDEEDDEEEEIIASGILDEEDD